MYYIANITFVTNTANSNVDKIGNSTYGKRTEIGTAEIQDCKGIEQVPKET